MSSLEDDVPVFEWVDEPSSQDEENDRDEDRIKIGMGGTPPEEPPNDQLA